MSVRSSRRLAVLLLLPGLVACSAIGDMDAAMRRVDVLDRAFGGARAAPPPAPVVATGPPKEDLPEPEPPEPVSEPTLDVERGMAPALAAASDPARRRAALIRDYPWLTRFWAELNPDQQGRVRRALARRGVPSDPAGIWDPLGLAERVRLVFGEG